MSILHKAETILHQVFGYEQFRQNQAEIVQQVCAQKNALVIMPTGSGKSLCYQVPALVLDGVVIVISPLIALMDDQVMQLAQLDVRVACLHSNLDYEAQQKIERQLLDQQLDLLYVAPERVLTPRLLGLLEQTPVALFAIDEAHCVSQWGHDFRPEYQQLSQLIERFPQVSRLALTATADELTRQDIVKHLQLENAQAFISSFDRPNIQYQVHAGLSNAKQNLLQFIRQYHSNDSGIVYCLSRKKVDDVAAWLSQQGLNALPYHAGLDAKIRQSNQQQFLMQDKMIMVATIAFGMGINKPDVRFVAHLNLPKSIENYYQETGRAGRDGLAATAWMSFGLQDVISIKQMLDSSVSSNQRRQVEQTKLQSMLGLAESCQCRRQTLLAYFGETLEEPCGNCDNCLQAPQTWDATLAAQQALSCVHRSGQRYGVNYLCDILRGVANERIRQAGHDKLGLFGIGRDISKVQWQSIFRQLIALAYLNVDADAFGGLSLDESCRSILRGEQKLLLRSYNATAKHPTYQTTTNGQKQFLNDLWQVLREKRRELASEQGVPAYVIFHDATLMEMAEQRPQTLAQMANLSGVGQKKLNAYGDIFLQLIQQHRQTPVDAMKTASADE
ncbi:MAG: DNA helicase RecQ, partial [Gammaproteobacteria bacterium]|nr:DNA helicase RecQ [Gammaproteobacteria bacterium]